MNQSTAIITGASRGLGLALTKAFAGAGWQVVVDGRDAATLTAAVAEVDGVTAVPGDVTDPAHQDELVRTASRLGDLALLVNNAGVLGPSPQPAVADYPVDALRDVVESNLVAPWALTQRALPTLRATGAAAAVVGAIAGAYPAVRASKLTPTEALA